MIFEDVFLLDYSPSSHMPPSVFAVSMFATRTSSPPLLSRVVPPSQDSQEYRTLSRKLPPAMRRDSVCPDSVVDIIRERSAKLFLDSGFRHNALPFSCVVRRASLLDPFLCASEEILECL
jgi:hypothetical protein